jgi:hypothetical protein
MDEGILRYAASVLGDEEENQAKRVDDVFNLLTSVSGGTENLALRSCESIEIVFFLVVYILTNPILTHLA